MPWHKAIIYDENEISLNIIHSFHVEIEIYTKAFMQKV
jgi:hypothetical protein